MPFLEITVMAEKKPHLYRLLQFMLKQPDYINTFQVVEGMGQRQLHYPRWKKYLQDLKDMGYLHKRTIYSETGHPYRVMWNMRRDWRERLSS